MRRIGLGLISAALALTACSDVQDPAANFQVRDGMHNPGMVPDYSYLYFLPPIVPSPTFPDGATFDSGLLPYLTVRVTDLGAADYGSGAPDAPAGATCSAASAALAGLSVDALSATYSLGWNTKKNGPDKLTLGHVYRICVWVNPPDVPGITTPERVIGYRDVMPDDGGADQPRNTDQAPVYQFGIGSNIPIKFKVLDGLFNADLCKSGTLGEDYDCTAQILTSNETALCDNATCLLTTGVMSQAELWLVEKFGVDNPACLNAADPEDPDTAVAGFPLATDIPQYAGCVRVTLFDEDQTFQGFLDSYGTIGACFYPESGAPVKIADGQDEAIQMHIQYPEAGPTIWALPWGSTGGIVTECELIETTAGGSGVGSQVAAAAKKLWRGTQQILNPWFAPPKVYAFHTGFGGHTSLSSDEDGFSDPGFAARVDDGGDPVATGVLMSGLTTSGAGDPQVFMLAWALPSQMAPSTFCAGTACSSLAASPLTVNLGEVVTVGVDVTDNGAIANSSVFGGRSLGDARAVEGATIHFDATDSQSGTDVSDVNGHASFNWTANAEGTTTITASGFGIGITGANGPYDAFVNGAYLNQPTLLGLGELTFTVQVCPKTPDADGAIADPTAGYYAGKTWQPVPVNLGGSSVGTAYLLAANDCDDLYIAFMVPGDVSNTTSLRFVFDNAPTGTSIDALTFSESADDDILSMTLTSGGLAFRDRYLSAACLGSKQADCGPLDARQDGSGGAGLNTFAAVFPAGGAAATTTWYVYEMKHPLKRQAGDVAPFQDFDRDPGQFLGWYLALYLGNGTKANAEFPDQKGGFKKYQPYLVK